MAPVGELALMVRVEPVRGPGDLLAVRGLFREYGAWLGAQYAPLVEAELANLPGAYAPPAGGLLLAWTADDTVAGCVAVRRLGLPLACEVKRLYVRETARGSGAGRALMDAALRFAEAAGYGQVLLDTLPRMVAAQTLYERFGFEPVAAYHADAAPGTLFFGKTLGAADDKR